MIILFTDTETTGLNITPNNNEAVQIGGILVEGANVLDRTLVYSQPTNWGVINKRALEVTKITLDDLKGYPNPKNAFLTFFAFLQPYIRDGEKIYLGGQNVVFDIKVLRLWWDTWRNPSLHPAFDDVFESEKSTRFELMTITKSLVKKGILTTNHKNSVALGAVANALQIKPEGDLHNAMVDIELTYRVMISLLHSIKSLNNGMLYDEYRRFMSLI